MLPRVLFAWLPFSVLLLLLGLYSQGEPFQFQHFVLALWLSMPVGVAVLRGGLGEANSPLQYPSLALLIVSAWILGVGPSLVVESEAARYFYRYTPIAMSLARVFFFCWCLVFSFASGRPRLQALSARATLPDFLACALVAGALALYLVGAGMFSFYQTSGKLLQAGSTESLAVVLGMPLFTLLPPLFFLALLRWRGGLTPYLLMLAGFAASWGLLFLLGSRTTVASAVACIFVLCRGLGIQLRAKVLVGLGIAMPALLVLILVYRTALAGNESQATNVSQFITVASDATSSLNKQQGQDDALALVSSNVRVRFWYGQQFCVLVDQWLDEGAMLRGSLLSGTIASLPTLLLKEKNALADDLNFEKLMHDSRRFPAIDLAPMPWMQWLYELGVFGLLIGTLLYAWFVRVIETRLSRTKSFYETLFLLEMFICILAPEHTTDWLVLAARNTVADVLLVGLLAKIITWFSQLNRRENKFARA